MRTWNRFWPLATSAALALGAPAALAQPMPTAIIAPMSDASDATSTPEEEPLVRPVGSFFSRFETRSHYDQFGLEIPARLVADQDAVYYRARFGLVTRAFAVGHGLHVTARLMPQSTGVWDVGGTGMTDAGFGMHEGFIQIAGDGFRLDAGRFEMSYGDELMIGNYDWIETGRSFDGMRLHIAPRAAGYFVDVFSTWMRDGLATSSTLGGLGGLGGVSAARKPFGAGDMIFSGVYAGLGHLIADDMDLDAYVLSLVQPRTPTDPGLNGDTGYLFSFGLRSKRRIGIFDARAEGGVQYGQAPVTGNSILAFSGDVELGVHVADDHLRIAVEGLYASGDDPNTPDVEGWNQLFPTAHKWLGVADIIGGRTNIMGGALHLAVKANDRLTLNLDGHGFLRPETGPGVDSYAGTELDLGANYGLGRGLALRTNYSVFLPNGSNDGSTLYATSHTAHFFELELKFTLPE